MKKILVLFAALMLIAFMPEVSHAQATSEMNDLGWSTYIPCANDGMGEWAVGTLRLHTVIVFNKDSTIKKIHDQPAGGELVGLETGTVYQPTGVTQRIWNDNSAVNYTYVNVYHMVGQRGIQYRVKVLYHYTINANGELTAEIDKSESVCK